jgi:hypothetical protein
LLLAILLLPVVGCGPTLDTTYGRSVGQSINGTNALVELFKERGHDVKAVHRLTDSLRNQADTIVRFAYNANTPPSEEAAWYEAWLAGGADRRLIYVPRDYDAAPEYWAAVRAKLPPDADPDLVARVEFQLAQSQFNQSNAPEAPRKALEDDWFAVEKAGGAPAPCKTLAGPWAKGIDAKGAALLRHRPLVLDAEIALLTGGGKTLAMEWAWPSGAKTLVVASGTFLLNGALLNRARRPLAERVVEWSGAPPRRVVFVEGPFVLAGEQRMPSQFVFFQIDPIDWVFVHLLLLLLIGVLVKAPILGRPRPGATTDSERPSAHAEALGYLLARTRDDRAARAHLEAYRRWRQPSATGPNP